MGTAATVVGKETREGTSTDSPGQPMEILAHLQSIEDVEARQEYWYKNIYQGHKVPQLTWRAVVMGGILGSLMSISNLYTTLKIGWSFGVAITACVLSFVIWNAFRAIFRKLTPMSILENNCMQSTASAAGYSTGATIGTAFGALLLITGHHITWQIVLPWTLVTAALGVFLAIPMKRQMINIEQLPFPDGIAAATTLNSLYAKSREAVLQAYSLIATLIAGAVVGFLGKGEFAWQKAMGLKLPELIPFTAKINGVQLSQMPSFGFEPSLLLIAAGMIVGLRTSISMLAGAALLYFVIGPMMINQGEIEAPAKLIRWALWSGTAIMVTSGLTSFALQWKTIARAFTGFKAKTNVAETAEMNSVEVPLKWLIAGLIPLVIAIVALQYVAFSINPMLGLVSVAMSGVLALVACRATGETNITPIGAMGKITQLTYAVLAPSNVTTNLMAASVTANIASSSADLLTDLKSGYLLGANARKQFIAQFMGVFFGAVAVVPAWFLMVPNKAALEAFNPPSANMWRAVAEALSYGIQYVPVTARWGILIGGVLGIVLALLEAWYPKARPYIPSAMGLGLSWVMPFANCLSFFVGAILALVWTKISPKTANAYVIPTASGAVAGESLACAVIAMITAISALAK
ncbi:MAG: OPT/YSL family transporter [Candidatus Obscuribacterales bacterium]|nr:OPT/YSL family transporter [Candidatus Obscuribacterales bacterium]